MNDPLRPTVLWGALVVAAALVGLAPTAALRVAVLGLGALGLVPLLGWLRIVSFTPAAAAGVGAVVAAWLLGRGQAVPVAFLAASVAAAAVGAAVTAVWPRRPPAGPAFVSVVAALAVWGLLLPRVVIRPSAQPVLFGIDLGSSRSLGVMAVGLLAVAALGLVNVGRSAAGREIAAVGVAEEIALRSGAEPAVARVRAGLLAGLFAGWAAVLLVLEAGALPALTQLSPGAAVVWLGVAALGGMASIGGAVVGAVAIGGLASLLGVPEAALAGLALAAVAVAGGRGLAHLIASAAGGAEPRR
jgi:ABC-type branched-subunit amino acid transport system permease subunit